MKEGLYFQRGFRVQPSTLKLHGIMIWGGGGGGHFSSFWAPLIVHGNKRFLIKPSVGACLKNKWIFLWTKQGQEVFPSPRIQWHITLAPFT
jgi:hypothetical protein